MLNAICLAACNVIYLAKHSFFNSRYLGRKVRSYKPPALPRTNVGEWTYPNAMLIIFFFYHLLHFKLTLCIGVTRMACRKQKLWNCRRTTYSINISTAYYKKFCVGSSSERVLHKLFSSEYICCSCNIGMS